MKKYSTIPIVALMVISVANGGSGEKLFENKCATCHKIVRPSDRSSLIAPPARGITMHVKMKYPEREEFGAFVKDYVLRPSRDKSLCRPESIERFGLMPSQKGNVTEKELEEISDYMYETFNGRGRGMGGGMGHGWGRMHSR